MSEIFSPIFFKYFIKIIIFTKSELFSPLMPTVFIIIIAFLIGNMFMSVYCKK